MGHGHRRRFYSDIEIVSDWPVTAETLDVDAAVAEILARPTLSSLKRGVASIIDVMTPAQLHARFPSHPVPIGMQPLLRFVDSSGHKWWLGANSFIDVRRHRLVVYNGQFTCP